MADESETIYGFGKGEAEQLLGLTGRDSVTFSRLNATPFDASVTYYAVTTSAITAFSGSTCGTGTAMIKSIDKDRVVTNFKEVDVINVSTTAIQTGKSVKLFRVGQHLSAVELC
jgi:hypothetical protein